MECKLVTVLFASFAAVSELIDTLWNVNLTSLVIPLMAPRELIDTLWNVNTATVNTIADNKTN